jgi:hypothetical protein
MQTERQTPRLRKIRTPRVPDTPTFASKKVSDFSVAQSRPVVDTQIESVEEKKLG